MIKVGGLEYKLWLKGELIACEEALFDGERPFDFRIYEDRDFEKTKGKWELTDNVIPVIVRQEGAVTEFGIKVTPITIYFLTEEGDIESKAVFDLFAQNRNLYRESTTENGVTSVTTHTYEATRITEAYTEVLAGYRACYVISGAVSEASGVADLTELSYKVSNDESEDIFAKLISFSYAYASTMQTYMNGSNQIAESHPSASACTMNIAIPCLSGGLITKCLNQAMGNVDADNAYVFTYTINGVQAANKAFRLQSCSFMKSAGEMPSVSLVFVR